MNDIGLNPTLLTADPWPAPQELARVPAHDFARAKAFLHALDPHAERFTFLLVNEAGHAYRPPIEQHCTLARMWPEVIRWNQLNDRCAVFVTINETDLKGRKTENIVRVRALFVDADTPESVAKVMDTIKQTGA